MFRSTFVLGMAPGALIDHSASRLGARIWRVKSTDGLVSLAEAYSCNQESTRSVLGDEQGMVPRLVEQTGGYARLQRDQSWVRPGYVEEVYVPVDAPMAGPV